MSDQIILQDTWRPRWYYVMRNKTTGKKYLGQTVRENMDKYCGSGGYWKAYCKKHGGWDRQNIEAIQQTWIVDKEQAQQWLDAFAAENDGYWLRSNTEWANACKETTEDSAFAGLTDTQRKTNGKISGKIAVESGQWKKFQSAGGKIAGKIQGKKNVESGQVSLMGKIASKKNVESGHMSRMGKIGGKIGGKIAGKISGKKNVDSGHWAKCQIAGRKARSQNTPLMSQFCKVFGITSPGSGFGNIDKAAFQVWRESLTQTAEIG